MEKLNNPPCSECVKTNNHCCLADIPHFITDAMYYKNLANKMNIECFIVKHPDTKLDGMVVLVNSSMKGKDITRCNCVFFIDGKCSIYEDRPTICRSFGTEVIPCRNEIAGFTTKEEIGALTKKDIKDIESYIDHTSIFDSIMRNS